MPVSWNTSRHNHKRWHYHVGYQVRSERSLVLISFFVKNKAPLYILDYHSKFPIVKRADSFAADDLVKAAKVLFAEFRLPKKIIWDVGTNFTSETFRQFCWHMNIEQAITSSYHYQSNGDVKACIKFLKHTIKKWLNTNNDVNLAL